jgi:hypothetical protein
VKYAMKTPVFLLFCCLFFDLAWGQERFELKNPSFEMDSAAFDVVPKGWMNLGSINHSPPDIQPGSFEVKLPAQAGKRYLGLVTRGNNTWEGVGQRLDGYMRRNATYTFKLWLNSSENYVSGNSDGVGLINHNNATVLRIWGYNSRTQSDELLAESPPITHSKWVEYSFSLKPTVDDFDEIDLMAYYARGAKGKEGNLLIDSCGPIELVVSEANSKIENIIPTPPKNNDAILLINPSFECKGRYESYLGWYWFGNQQGLRLSIEPGHFIGSRKADDGEHFLALLSEVGEGTQGISQALKTPLKKVKTYKFSVSLARQKTLKFRGGPTVTIRQSDMPNRSFKYKSKVAYDSESLKLEIWGYNRSTRVREILDESPMIDHKEWKKYSFVLTPTKSDYDVIVLHPVLVNLKGKKSSKGHILIDNCSNISNY